MKNVKKNSGLLKGIFIGIVFWVSLLLIIITVKVMLNF